MNNKTDLVEALRLLVDAVCDGVADRLISRQASAQPAIDVELDRAGIAVVTGLSEPTIDRMVRAGKIPSYKVGRSRRFNKQAVLNHLHGGSVEQSN